MTRIGKRRAAEHAWRRQVLRGSSSVYAPRLFPTRAWGWAVNGVWCFVIVSVLDIVAHVAGFATALRRMWP